MRSTPVTPGRQYSTVEAGHGGAAACQHRFARGGMPHYCTYIQAPGIQRALYPASTPDEQLVVSYLAASTLWWHLQARELTAIERAFDGVLPLATEQALLVAKRLDRCIVLGQTMREASALLTRCIVASAPQIAVGFRIKGDLNQLPSPRDLTAVLARLQARARTIQTANPAVGTPLRSRIRAYAELAGEVRRAVLRLIATLNDAALPVVPLELLLSDELLSFSAETLHGHHPQTLTDADATDPLLFIASHQIFEVWFPAVIGTLGEALRLLTQETPQVIEAAALIQRSADLVGLWQRMIHLPQTMSAADYIAFRAQLEGGSGAESEQFRQIELLAGLRDARYRQSLEQMSLLTPRLEALWQSPSLNDAILGVLTARGILSPELPPTHQAERLAAIWLPTGTLHPHADLAALCQAALHLDEQFWLFRQHHMAMVRAMIGGKPSIGVGGVQNYERLTHDPEAQPVAGLPYLQQTTNNRLFPIISLALEHLQENWQAVAETTRRA